MALQVHLSRIGGNTTAFDAAVTDHIAKLAEFTQTVGKPRPTAHSLVEQAIKRVQHTIGPDTYEPDYEYVNDIPPPPPPLTIEDKKNQLHSEVIKAETEAKNKILPPRKMRHLNYSYETATHKLEEERTPEDVENIKNFIETNNKWAAIGRIAAQAESDIEDLTEDNVYTWQIPEFG